tara:strand:- start:237 stop:473 length:237 start_codon:yes stop_codon:yes gene_type:complete
MKEGIRDRVLGVVERYFDEWLIEEDWWHGLWDCDINVYMDEKGAIVISVYGLTPTSDIDLYETNTSDLKATFNIKGVA